MAVFERSTLRPRGAGLLVHPNGISALEAIDPSLAEEVLALDWPQGACRSDQAVVQCAVGGAAEHVICAAIRRQKRGT